MLSGMEIWPLFVHSTHRLPEIVIILEIDILRTSGILKILNGIKWYVHIYYILRSLHPPLAYIGIILEIDIWSLF